MIPYLELVISFQILVKLFNFYVDGRQIAKFQRSQRPADLEQIITEEQYKKSQVYGFDKLAFSMVSHFITFLYSLATLYFYWMPYLWNVAGNFSDHFIIQPLIYTHISGFIELLMQTPFSLYNTFVIEERHGFNKQTLKLFITDLIKSQGIQIIMTTIVVSAIVYLMESTGEMFYLYVWAFISVLLLIFMSLFHNLIAPLFNKFTPLEEGQLKKRIEEIAERIKFPLKQIYVIDGSKRSDHSNAYFFGFMNNKRIVIYDTLLSSEKDIKVEEVASIVAHELGHWQHNHFIKRLLIIEVYIFALFYLFAFIVYNPQFYYSFGFHTHNKFIGLNLFSHIFQPVSFVLNLMVIRLSRSHEFQADQFSKKLDLSSELKEALIKIHTQNSGNVDPDAVYSSVHFSHPPLKERLQQLG